MRWRRGSDYYIESDSGYRVSKSFTGTEVIYTAWAPRPQPDGMPVMLRSSAEKAVALAACEQHLIDNAPRTGRRA